MPHFCLGQNVVVHGWFCLLLWSLSSLASSLASSASASLSFFAPQQQERTLEDFIDEDLQFECDLLHDIYKQEWDDYDPVCTCKDDTHSDSMACANTCRHCQNDICAISMVSWHFNAAQLLGRWKTWRFYADDKKSTTTIDYTVTLYADVTSFNGGPCTLRLDDVSCDDCMLQTCTTTTGTSNFNNNNNKTLGNLGLTAYCGYAIDTCDTSPLTQNPGPFEYFVLYNTTVEDQYRGTCAKSGATTTVLVVVPTGPFFWIYIIMLFVSCGLFLS